MNIGSLQLEVCAETSQGCSAAFQGGAHRIEICTALNEGGLTPSHGLIEAAIAAAGGLPVYALLRPRRGNFVYSDAEFEIVCADMKHAAGLGVSGFVTGILTRQRTVDEVRMRRLIELAGQKEVTFHRAFDHIADLRKALDEIIAMGCGRVLTSGGRPTVAEGMNTIAGLARQAKDRIRIAAGGGVTPKVAAELLQIARVDLHVSLRATKTRTSRARDPLWDTGNEVHDISARDVQEMVSTLRSFAG